MTTKQVIKKSNNVAKRRLKDITFEHDGAHLALCSKEQGAANMQEQAVILKSKNFSPELIEKAQRVQVTMEIPEFLERFFGLWGSDAEVLARLMGYVPEDQGDDWSYEDWIQEKVESFTILKSLHEAPSLTTALAELTEDQYSMILDDQEKIAKSLKEFDASNGVDNSAETKVEKVEPVGSKTVKKGKKMADVETIEKSKYVEIEKQMQAQKEELEKARELLKAAEVAKQEQILKAKTASVAAVVGNDEQVQAIMKAAGNAEQADFEALVAVFKSMKEAVEKSALFNEQGASGDAEVKVEKSKIKQALAEKYAAKK